MVGRPKKERIISLKNVFLKKNKKKNERLALQREVMGTGTLERMMKSFTMQN